MQLANIFMLSHVEDDGPVRIDGAKLGVLEALGLELDEAKLGAFAGALNAMDFPVQLLIRQHAPELSRLRTQLAEEQPENLPAQTEAAADSLRGLLSDLENREGVVDRRFYAVCEFERVDDLRGLMTRAGLSVNHDEGPSTADADSSRRRSAARRERLGTTKALRSKSDGVRFASETRWSARCI